MIRTDLTFIFSQGDIFFQITAPTSLSWVALGQGSSMAGSNIFVVYSSADGKNVTLSPRTASGHTQPRFNSAARAILLGGSGITNGTMVANIRCSNCDSWTGGTMDFTGTSSTWIYAMASGDPVNSDDVNADINQHSHSGAASFSWDISTAKGGSDANPFLTNNAAASTSSASTASADGNNNMSTTGSSASDSDASDGGSTETFDRASTAHAVLAGIAFVALFPFGGILIRLANFPSLVRVHAALQLLASALYAAAFGIGVWMIYESPSDDLGHPILGGIILLALLVQPFTGWFHHRRYAATNGNSGRTKTTWAHVSVGRVAVLLGMINGGLGLQMAGVESGSVIAYSVIVALVGVVYIASIFIGERRRRRRMGTSANAGMNMGSYAPDAQGNLAGRRSREPHSPVGVGIASESDSTKDEDTV